MVVWWPKSEPTSDVTWRYCVHIITYASIWWLSRFKKKHLNYQKRHINQGKQRKYGVMKLQYADHTLSIYAHTALTLEKNYSRWNYLGNVIFVSYEN